MKHGACSLLLLILVATPAAAQTPAAGTTEAVREAIDRGNAQYVAAFAAGEAAGVAGVYDAHGARLYPDGSILRGRAAIEDDVHRFIDRVGPVIVTLETHLVWVLEDRAYEPGRWTYTFTPPGREQRTISGTYVNIWNPRHPCAIIEGHDLGYRT